MPKVTKEYIDKKKAEIVEAAKEVFKRKPLYEMNMMDVIKEAGLSKGGIYRYFKDIDEVIIELINSEGGKHNYSESIEKIINSDENGDEKIKSLFKLLSKHIDENIDTLGKIQFELTILDANDSDRSQKILSGLKEYADGKYLITALYDQIANKAKGNTDISLEYIYNYIQVYIEGMIKIQVFQRCYKHKPAPMNVEIMMNMLADTIINMI